MQAPVATRNEILAYLQSLSSHRSLWLGMRASLKTPPSNNSNNKNEATPVSKSPVSKSPSSPLQSILLFPNGQLPPLLPTTEELINNLSAKFQRYVATGRSSDDFTANAEVQHASRHLVLLHGMIEPIMLFSDRTTGKEYARNYWLFLCRCGEVVSVGTINNGVQLCNKCRCKSGRRNKQLENAAKLSNPSSTVPFGSLISPVKTMLKDNLRQQLYNQRRCCNRLKTALAALKGSSDCSFSANDDDAPKLFDQAVSHVVDEREGTVHLIKLIVAKLAPPQGNANNEANVTEFAENIVNEITNYAKLLNNKKSQLRFSPRVLRLALSLYMRSKKGYEVFRNQSITILPSESMLQKIQQKMLSE